MNDSEMINKVCEDFKRIGIQLDSCDSIIIPGFSPDAYGDYYGRNIYVECKILRNINLRQEVLSVINYYRKNIDYVGDSGFVVLAVYDAEKDFIKYFDLTPLVHSEKTNIKSDLDSLLKKNRKLSVDIFASNSEKLFAIKLISKKKTEKANNLCLYFVRTILLMLAIASVVLFVVLDGLGIYVFSPERLIIIGILVLLLILPFIKKISINGNLIELKEAKDEDDKKRRIN